MNITIHYWKSKNKEETIAYSPENFITMIKICLVKNMPFSVQKCSDGAQFIVGKNRFRSIM